MKVDAQAVLEAVLEHAEIVALVAVDLDVQAAVETVQPAVEVHAVRRVVQVAQADVEVDVRLVAVVVVLVVMVVIVVVVIIAVPLVMVVVQNRVVPGVLQDAEADVQDAVLDALQDAHHALGHAPQKAQLDVLVTVQHHALMDVLVDAKDAKDVAEVARLVVVVDVAVVVAVVVLVVVVVVVVVVVLVEVLVMAIAITAPHLATRDAQQAVEVRVAALVLAAPAVLIAHHVIPHALKDAHHVLEDAKDLVLPDARAIVTLTVLPLARVHALLTVQQHAFQLAKRQLGLVL